MPLLLFQPFIPSVHLLPLLFMHPWKNLLIRIWKSVTSLACWYVLWGEVLTIPVIRDTERQCFPMHHGKEVYMKNQHVTTIFRALLTKPSKVLWKWEEHKRRGEKGHYSVSINTSNKWDFKVPVPKSLENEFSLKWQKWTLFLQIYHPRFIYPINPIHKYVSDL